MLDFLVTEYCCLLDFLDSRGLMLLVKVDIAVDVNVDGFVGLLDIDVCYCWISWLPDIAVKVAGFVGLLDFWSFGSLGFCTSWIYC